MLVLKIRGTHTLQDYAISSKISSFRPKGEIFSLVSKFLPSVEMTENVYYKPSPSCAAPLPLNVKAMSNIIR